MIKNIVFDIGNVLISFKPKEYLEKKGYPEELKEKILADIFYSPEWLALDNGDITIAQAIETIAMRSSLGKNEIAQIFDLLTDILFPLEQNVKLLSKLKQEGYKLYYLSNFTTEVFPKVQNRDSFFCLFDGGIISAHVKVSKPEEAIYRLLIDKYSLIADESLFIDDLEINVKAAEKVGMKGLYTCAAENIEPMLREILAGS
jgi:putative hydrolase of the HAD superfamily